MSGNKRGLAAAFAGGMIALAVLAGCASAPSPSPSATGLGEAGQKEETGGAAQADDHGAMAESAAGQSTMDHAGMDHSGMQHGESPEAPAAVAPGQPAATLRPGPLDAPAPTSVLDAQRSAEMAGGGHSAHGVGRYRHVDAGRGPGAYEGSEKQTPGAGPQEEHSHESPGAAEGEEAAVYACPMHPEVTSNAPGKCSKCGMALVERRKE